MATLLPTAEPTVIERLSFSPEGEAELEALTKKYPEKRAALLPALRICEREFGSENTANVLLLAHQLAPQVSEITMNAARLLISRREYDDAKALLRPLAADPHNAGLAEAARRMMEQARRAPASVTPPTPQSD